MRMHTAKQASGCGVVTIGDWRHIQINGPAIWFWKMHGNALKLNFVMLYPKEPLSL